MNDEQKQMVVSIIKRILNSPKKEYDGLFQYEFNCPTAKCRNDHNKFNLGYNSNKGVFRCWKCNYKGLVHALITDYGSKEDIERLNVILPKSNLSHKRHSTYEVEFHDEAEVECELPEGFIPLSEKGSSQYYRKAVAYLRERKVSDETIKKYNIGYTETGPRKFRIIIPSYSASGKLNYYEARAYLPWIKPNYHKPDYPHKNDIIFNSKNINFNLPVFLVEGVFDMFPIYNAAALLGKEMSLTLLSKLVKYNTRVIICLDEDAIKDSIAMYDKLMSYGLDVWLVEVKGDIAKYFQDNGKEAVIEMLKNKKKLDFKYLMELGMKDSRLGRKRYNDKYIENDWEKIKRQFKNIEYENKQGETD